MPEGEVALNEHCRSYYAATANDMPDFPSLRGSVRADVCVIGGGFTGVAAALTLAERGYSVVLLEARRVGWGASGRNGGQLIGGISGAARLLETAGPAAADLLWTMAWRGHEIIEQRIARYRIACDLKWGYVDVAIKARHMEALRQDAETLRRRGFDYPYRLVEKAELQELLGTRAYIGGLVNRRNAHLHPLNLCIGEARAAAQLGVRLFERSAVEELRPGARPVARTADGEVQADSIVLAGNAYHRLQKQVLSGLQFPAGSFIVATAPLDEALARQINREDLAVCDPNYVLDYFRLSSDRRLLFGGRCNYSGREPRSIEAALVPRMLKIYPQLKGVRIDYQWGGTIGIVINRVPLIGRIGDNVYYAQGYSGHGVNVSHLAGEIIAEAIAGTMERLDLFARVRHRRIPFGQQFGNHFVALGMIYFRLRDLL